MLVEVLEQRVALPNRELLYPNGEPRVDEQVAPPRLWVGTHDRVLHLHELSEGLAVPLALSDGLQELAEGPGAVVHRGQPVHQRAQGCGQPLVGGLGVGPERVAAGRGDDDGVEDRAEGGVSTNVTSVCHFSRSLYWLPLPPTRLRAFV